MDFSTTIPIPSATPKVNPFVAYRLEQGGSSPPGFSKLSRSLSLSLSSDITGKQAHLTAAAAATVAIETLKASLAAAVGIQLPPRPDSDTRRSDQVLSASLFFPSQPSRSRRSLSASAAVEAAPPVARATHVAVEVAVPDEDVRPALVMAALLGGAGAAVFKALPELGADCVASDLVRTGMREVAPLAHLCRFAAAGGGGGGGRRRRRRVVSSVLSG
ncbi:hypothetical protein MBM_09261 [Drepanopeziza brunnea f. sp. 'multigermtubi' MB_m1]|uniref:Uncharacterized protein n=1 Tax=Marssonina brunnea f. sp. multigermtubi (strain MB_m1) TaxID=1072389 RepID=K1WKF0_MARBU|nr:uncharacterized protein MBM_09261 [Drepanopeziza brunnea f. sp. 'multigermtubi' MB_m1]EKD12692.1 hypothetical protein MBM_09261 [Drepanopeziza brunnea f. sp. 'multigermtubi' MB_m1]